MVFTVSAACGMATPYVHSCSYLKQKQTLCMRLVNREIGDTR